MLRHLDLFSGIGGFALAARMVGGYETVGFCEIEPYCQAVLRKHWPGVPIYDDVRSLPRLECDVLTGGFPCQDISVAGRQAGIEGSRSGLWSELARIIGDIRPSFALMENVPNLLAGNGGQWFGRVLGDLAEIGYDAQWHCVPASHVGAPHRRDRVWIVAYPCSERRQQVAGGTHADEGAHEGRAAPQADQPSGDGQRRRAGTVADAYRESIYRLFHERSVQRSEAPAPAGAMDSCDKDSGASRPFRWLPEPDVGRVVNGLSRRVVESALRGLGNSIVPQVAAIFLEAIRETHEKIMSPSIPVGFGE